MTSLRPLAALALVTLALAGCHVNTSKDGKNENVNISTPFGGMQVKTNDSVDASAIGLTVYPGAVVYNDKDHNSADVNMSFGDFHLGVKAATYKTTDSADKIVAFYRKDLARFGDVIECKGNKPVGEPTRTSLGLNCSDNQGTHIKTGDSHSHGVSFVDDGQADLQLRAGSEQHQHIVGIDPKDGFNKIGLIMLDLPTHLDKHDDKDSE